jgi:hypothetical protein
MANEITIRGLLAFAKGDAAKFDQGELLVTMAGTKWLEARQTVGTTEEALNLGEVTAGSALLIIRNRDATNKVLVKPASGGVALIEVPAGETSGPFRFSSTVTAPFVQAVTGAVDISYLLVSA